MSASRCIPVFGGGATGRDNSIDPPDGGFAVTVSPV